MSRPKRGRPPKAKAARRSVRKLVSMTEAEAATLAAWADLHRAELAPLMMAAALREARRDLSAAVEATKRRPVYGISQNAAPLAFEDAAAGFRDISKTSRKGEASASPHRGHTAERPGPRKALAGATFAAPAEKA